VTGKGRSGHGGLLAPYRQLKSQVGGTLNRTATRQPNPPGTDGPDTDEAQRQILYLRKDNVGT